MNENPLTAVIKQLKTFKRLALRYGQFKSIANESCIDANEEAIPWYTYPTIEYLSQFDYRKLTVFEWGSGNSSLFWAKRAKQVTSMESNSSWHKKISKKSPKNLNIILEENPKKYVSGWIKNKYDVIIIDGDQRKKCSEIAPEHLNDGGLIILDNAEQFPKLAKKLRTAGLIQIDFAGFGPINDYCWVTSIFLKRDFKLKALKNIQPQPTVGRILEK